MTILVDPSQGVVEINHLESWCREFLDSLMRRPLANRFFVLKDPCTLIPANSHVRIFVGPMNRLSESDLFSFPALEIRPMSQKDLVNPRYIMYYDAYRLCDVFARVRKWSTEYDSVIHDALQRNKDMDLEPCLAARLPTELITQVLLFLC